MPVYKVEVTRALKLRKVLYVQAADEGAAEGRACEWASEHLADSDMDVESDEQDASVGREALPDEVRVRHASEIVS